MQPREGAVAAIPAMMRAALLLGYGGPEQLVVRSDVPVPLPQPGDVLIEVAACGVNNTDINTRAGWYSTTVTESSRDGAFDEIDAAHASWGETALTFPRIQGADVCGRVVGVGEGADRTLVGQRVLVDPWLRDPEDPWNRDRSRYLGSEHDGGFAEYVCVPARNVHPIRSALSDVELATFACSGSAAEHMLVRARVAAGDTVVVTGASGGVGSFLVQLAKRRGARVIAVASAAKAAAVEALGADRVIARETANLAAAVADAAGGPIDVVADVVGGEMFTTWLDVLRRGGTYVTAGAIAGPIVALDLRTLYLKDLSLYGATVFGPGLFSDLVGYIERGEIRPVVARTFPLEQIHAAQQLFAEKRHVGSMVIDVAGSPT